MKQQEIPRARIFVCTNEKLPPKAQCLKGEGERIVVWLKEEVKKRNLHNKIWVTRTRCQGYCEPQGTALVFTPTNKQYSSVLLGDVQALFDEFLAEINT